MTNLSARHLEVVAEVDRATVLMRQLVIYLNSEEVPEPDGVWAHRFLWTAKNGEPGLAVRISEGRYEVDSLELGPNEKVARWTTTQYDDPEDMVQFILGFLR